MCPHSTHIDQQTNRPIPIDQQTRHPETQCDQVTHAFIVAVKTKASLRSAEGPWTKGGRKKLVRGFNMVSTSRYRQTIYSTKACGLPKGKTVRHRCDVTASAKRLNEASHLVGMAEWARKAMGSFRFAHQHVRLHWTWCLLRSAVPMVMSVVFRCGNTIATILNIFFKSLMFPRDLFKAITGWRPWLVGWRSSLLL